VESQKGFANEPIPLGVSLNAASGSETLTLVGLANGTKLSAGAPLGLTGWQVSAREISSAMAYAPKDFVGVMDAAIDLRSPRDRLMDSQFVRLEWMPKKETRLTPPPAPRLEQPKLAPAIQLLDADELATLMRRGEDFLKNGDIASARLILRRAANAGHAQAALALGVTFDPRFLAEQGVLGFAPDVAQARAWYERAAELGSSEAARRLERLPGRGR
jgi:TPR repeat protein